MLEKKESIMQKNYMKEILQIGLPITIQSILKASDSRVAQGVVGTIW